MHGGNGTGANIYNEPFKGVNYTIFSDGGHAGHPCERADGGGGGGGGAGYVPDGPGTGAGAGGAGGGDGYRGGLGGEGGRGAYRTDYANKLSDKVAWNNGQGYIKLTYDYYIDVYDYDTETITTQREVEREIETSINQHIDFSGTKGKTLTVKADYNTVEDLKCIVSSPTATNSPVTSDEVQFSSHSDLIDKTLFIEQAFWQFDRWRGGDATGAMRASLSSSNLTNGEVTLTYDDGTSYEAATNDDVLRGKGINIFTSFYVTSDTEVEIDLYGGRGVPWTTLTNTYAPGTRDQWTLQRAQGLAEDAAKNLPGEGGYARIRFTMKANREYTVAGMFGTINTPYLYELDELVAVVGQGGGNNVYGDGGGGGGFNMRAEDGTNSGGWSHDSGYGSPVPTWGLGIRLQAELGSAYYPYRTDWAGSYLNNMLDYINNNVDYAQSPDGRDGGRVKRYSRSINNNSDISTRKMWTRQANGYDAGLPEQNIMQDTATIERGFWDIDYSFLGTAGGRADGTRKTDQASLEGMAIGRANGLYDANCVGGNGALGGSGGTAGTGGGGGGGWLNPDKKGRGTLKYNLISTNNGRTGGGTEDSKIVIRLAT